MWNLARARVCACVCLCVSECVHACACVSARVRVLVRACARACVRVRVRACVFVSDCLFTDEPPHLRVMVWQWISRLPLAAHPGACRSPPCGWLHLLELLVPF